MSRNPLLFLEDIENSCAKIVRYTERRSKADLLEDDIRMDAVLLNLYVIGEAVKKLPDDLRGRHPEVAWREIAGMRDFIAHAYFALDHEIVWDAVKKDVPALLLSVKKVIETERQGQA